MLGLGAVHENELYAAMDWLVARAEISSPEFPGERLIVCRNPVLADQRWRKRQELLAATEVKLAAIVKATQRAKEPLRGASDIGVRWAR